LFSSLSILQLNWLRKPILRKTGADDAPCHDFNRTLRAAARCVGALAYTTSVGLFPTGTYRNPEDRSGAPGPEPYTDPISGEEVTPMQQYDYRPDRQVRARFYGAEAEVGLPVWQEGGHRVMLKRGDYVRRKGHVLRA
jgi:hypothetical protein